MKDTTLVLKHDEAELLFEALADQIEALYDQANQDERDGDPDSAREAVAEAEQAEALLGRLTAAFKQAQE